MKKCINKKYLSLFLAGLMCVSSITPVFAYDTDTNGNSVENVEYQNSDDSDFSNVTNVFAEIGSEYKVTIPKVIVLSGTTKKANYYVKVEGDIAGYEIVNIIPDDSVLLHSTNKSDQIGTIVQDKTVWKVSDFNVNANGEVSADGLTAGKWSGVFNFNINMESHEDNNTNDPTQTDAEKKLTVNTNGLAMDAGTSHEVHAFYDGKDVTNEIDWSSDSSKITVNKGIVMTSATAQVGDTATITASMDDDTSGLVAALDKIGLVAVASAEDGNDSVSFTVTIVEINFDDSEGNEIDNISILPGEHKSIKAKIVPETTGTVVWSCTAPSGVTLQKSGNNTTIYIADDMPEGRTYNVIATYGDYAKTITLNIASKTKDNLSVSIEDGNTLTIGDVKDVNVTTTDNSTPSNVVITSSDESVAKIVDGKIETVGAGEATITISANGSVSKTINIIVEEAQTLEAGLYDANDNLIVTWDDMVTATGFNVEKDYVYSNSKTAGFASVEKKYPNIKKVVIPENVARIGNYSFGYSSSIEEIVMPNSIKTIGEFSFISSSIKSIKMSKSITSIGNYAFSGCTSLESINSNIKGKGVIPDSVTTIGKEAFWYCNFSELEIPDSVTKIDKAAFGRCCSLKSVKLSNSITKISEEMFRNCESLETIEIPNSVTSIGKQAFLESGLKSIKIPDSVTNIDGAFNMCYSLESVEIPNSITAIKYYTFNYCKSLKSIKIPNSVTTILQAFENCPSLETIEMPNTITNFDTITFSGTKSVKEIIFGGTKEEWKSAYQKWGRYIYCDYIVHCIDGDTPKQTY